MRTDGRAFKSPVGTDETTVSNARPAATIVGSSFSPMLRVDLVIYEPVADPPAVDDVLLLLGIEFSPQPTSVAVQGPGLLR